VSSKGHKDAIFEVFRTMKIEGKVIWVVMPCNAVMGYPHFGGPCWYPTTELQGITTLKTSTWT